MSDTCVLKKHAGAHSCQHILSHLTSTVLAANCYDLPYYFTLLTAPHISKQ